MWAGLGVVLWIDQKKKCGSTHLGDFLLSALEMWPNCGKTDEKREEEKIDTKQSKTETEI